MTSSEKGTIKDWLAASSAGLIGRLICHPIDTIKSKLQASDSLKGIRSTVTQTIRTEGVSGLYKGIGAVSLGSIPGVCIYFMSYEHSRDRLLTIETLNKYPSIVHMISGMIAEISCCGIFLPVDVIKERLQVQSNRKSYKYTGSINAFQTIVQQEGIRGLYKGYAATIFSYGPFSAIYFTLYEKCLNEICSYHGKERNSYKFSFWEFLFGSAIAGGVASFVTNPLEIGKLRYQVQQSIRLSSITVPQEEVLYRSMLHATSDIYARHGVVGLFKGAGTRVLFHTPSTAITMAVYEQCKSLWSYILS